MARAFDQNIYDVGQRIREKRQIRGMSQTDLALAMDTTKTVISRWENGERVIRLDSLFCLSDALDISPVYILCGNAGESDDEHTLMDQLRELSPDRKHFAFQVIRTLVAGLRAETVYEQFFEIRMFRLLCLCADIV